MDFLPRTLLFYILSHVYLFWHFYLLLGKKGLFLLTIPFFVCMGLFPFVYHLLPTASYPQHIFGHIGRIWLPFAFFSMLAFAAADGVFILARAYHALFSTQSWSGVPGKVYLLVLIIAAGCLYAYGIYEARHPKITRLELPTEKLPPDTGQIRIVFAADMHIGPQSGPGLLRKTINLIMSQQPDIILLGGDLLDDALQGRKNDLESLSGLKAPLGVYTVLGNHDSFGGYQRAEEFINKTGIVILADQSVEAGPLRIVGLDDPDVRAQKQTRSVNPARLLNEAPHDRYTVLLDHRPILRPESIGLFDLQLSGHTHGGNIIMLKALLESIFKTPTGLSAHSSERGESFLYVTTGVGFSKLPIRLFVPPEIVVIDLLGEKRQ